MAGLNILSVRTGDFIVSEDELSRALSLKGEEELKRFTKGCTDWKGGVHQYLLTLSTLKLEADLEVYMHILRDRVKKDLPPNPQELEELYEMTYQRVKLGRIQIGGGRILLNGLEVGEELLMRWLEQCLTACWRDPNLTLERGAELAELLANLLHRAEARSLETLRRVLGEEAARQLLERGELPVRTPSGEEYVVTSSAEVYRRLPGGERSPVCVQVEGGENLPRYDLVLAKYLTLRDHPELIGAGGMADWRRRLEAERRGLEEALSDLRRELAEHGSNPLTEQAIRHVERRLAEVRAELERLGAGSSG